MKMFAGCLWLCAAVLPTKGAMMLGMMSGGLLGGGGPPPMVPSDSSGVSAGAGDQSDQASLSRYLLQKQLIAREPELTQIGTAIFTNQSRVYASLQTMKSAVDNLTQIITADASAGGILATSRDLMQQIPQTQKLMQTIISKLFQTIQTDAAAVNASLSGAETDYRIRMQADADSVARALAYMDAQMARQAYQQSASMKAAALQMQTKLQNGMIQNTQSMLNSALSKFQAGSGGLSQSAVAAGQALSDAAELPSKIVSAHQAKLDVTKGRLDAHLSDAEAAASATLDAQSDSTMSTVESAAARMAVQFNTNISSTQNQVLNNLQSLQTSAVRNASRVNTTIQQTAQVTLANIQQVQGVADSNLTQINLQTQRILGDSTKTASDSSNTLSMMGSQMSSAENNFQTNIGVVQAGVPGALNGVLTRSVQVGSDIGSDSVHEMYLQNAGIASIQDATNAQLQFAGAAMDGRISDARNGTALAGLALQQGVDSATGAIQDNSQLVAQRTAMLASTHSNNLANVVSVMGGSIDDVASVLGDSSNASRDGLTALQRDLINTHAAQIQAILDKARSLGQDGTASLEQFLQSIVGPNSDITAKKFADMASMLETLATMQEGLQSGQADVMAAAQNNFKSNTGAMKSMLGIVQQQHNNATQITNNLSAYAQQTTTDAKSQLTQQAITLQQSAASASDESLAKIDSLIGNVNDQFRTGQSNVSQSIVSVQGDVSNGTRMYGQMALDSQANLAQLGSVSISLLARTKQQVSSDTNDANSMIRGYQNGFVDKYRARTQLATDEAIGPSIASLNASRANQNVVTSLTTSLGAHLSQMDNDIRIASQYNDGANSELAAKATKASQWIAQQKSALNTALDTAVAQFEGQLKDKRNSLNQTQSGLKMQLTQVEQLVRKAQTTLQSNLDQYQSALNQIVAEIRSYMNLSQLADETTLRNDISNQIMQVNASDLNLGAISGAIEQQLAESAARGASVRGRNGQILSDLISGATDLSESNSNGTIMNRAGLTSVGLHVDSAVQKLHAKLIANSKGFGKIISDSSGIAAGAIADSQYSQKQILDYMRTRSADIASQGRLGYIANLDRVGAMDNRVGLVSHHLGGILEGANSTINGVASSAADHMGVAQATIERLRSRQFGQVASVSDVMNAFAATVTGFVNETVSSMDGIMDTMTGIDQVGSAKLKAISVRTGAETDWVDSSLNKTGDAMNMQATQTVAGRESLKSGLEASRDKLFAFSQKYDTDMQSVSDGIAKMNSEIKVDGQQQVDRVHQWIQRRSAQLRGNRT